MIRFVALILVSLGLLTAHAEQRMALLIGNEAYGTPGLNVLENPHGDVDRVAAALRQAGFTDVTVLKDLDEGATRAALQAFRGKLRAGGSDAIGFFYYSGHGASLEQGRQRVSYLIPTGNPVEFADDLETYGVEIQREIELLEATGAGAVFFVVDACRNTLTRRASMGGGGTKGVGVVSAPPGLLIAYSAADGQFADDDAIFSTALSEEIVRAGQTAETAFSNVARAVGAKKPGFDRLPVIQPRLSKTVCFRGCRLDPQIDADTMAWQAAERLNTLQAYEAYLTFHPNGANAAIARARIDRLRPSETPSPTTETTTIPRPTVTASSRRPGGVFRDCDDCPEMVVVPAGEFVMGSPEGEEWRQSNEGPQRTVRIGYEFAVGKFEVTWAEWEACVVDGGCESNLEKTSNWGVKGDAGWGKGSRPVINVSWEDAKAYVRWLSRKTGERYRLLSEAEWEYVARAGTRTPFYFGNTITPDQANYDGNDTYDGGPKGTYHEKTMPVGSYPRNAFGLHDLHGNVWEWVEDCYVDSYSGAPTDGSARDASDCSLRVLRGGSWYDDPQDLRSAYRNWYVPTIRSSGFGFRVARTL